MSKIHGGFGGQNCVDQEFCISDKNNAPLTELKEKLDGMKGIKILICRYYDDDSDVQRKRFQDKVSKKYFYYENIIGIYDKIEWYTYGSGVVINLKTDYTNRDVTKDKFPDPINTIEKRTKTPEKVYFDRIDKDEFYLINIQDENLIYDIPTLFNNGINNTGTNNTGTSAPDPAPADIIKFNDDDGSLKIDCKFNYKENLKENIQFQIIKITTDKAEITKLTEDDIKKFKKDEETKRYELNLKLILQNYLTEAPVQTEISAHIKPIIIELFKKEVAEALKLKEQADKDTQTNVKQIEDDEQYNNKYPLVIKNYNYINNQLKIFPLPDNKGKPTDIQKLKDLYRDIENVKPFLELFSGTELQDDMFKMEDLGGFIKGKNIPVGYIEKKLDNSMITGPIGFVKSAYRTLTNVTSSGPKMDTEEQKYIVFLTPKGKFSIYGKRTYTKGDLPPNVATRYVITSPSSPDTLPTLAERNVDALVSYDLDLTYDVTPVSISSIPNKQNIPCKFKSNKRNYMFDVNLGGRVTRRKGKSYAKKSKKKFNR
jgi:hypothetical protein